MDTLAQSARLRYVLGMEYYTLSQAAELANLQAVTLRKYCIAGKIGRKLGNQWVLTREDIETVRAMNHRPGRPRKS